MDIRERIANAKSPEEMEQYLLDLDSEFRFKCRRCGKCCKNQDTVHAQRASGRNRVRGEQGRAPHSAAPAPAPKPPAPAAPAQKAPAQQAGFASAFGSVYGSGNGKSGAGDRKMF